MAIFGTIYASRLPEHLATAIPPGVDPGVDPRVAQSVQSVHAPPSELKTPIVQAYVDALQTMFLVAAPVGLLAFAVALFLKEVPLRDSPRVVATGNSILEPAALQLVNAGYVTEAEGHFRFTPKGTEAFSRLIGACRAWLLARLADWNKADNHQFAKVVDRAAEEMISSSREMSAGRHAALV